MIFTILITIIIGAVFYSWINVLFDKKRHNVPGPFPLPVIGNALHLLVQPKDFLPVLSKFGKKYGGTTSIYLLSKRYVVLSKTNAVEALISSTEHTTKGRSYKYLESWLGRGLLTASGERWRTHRKFLTPAFHFNILQTFLPVFLKNDKILIQKLEKIGAGKPVDLFPMIALTALDNVTESIMGVSYNAQEDDSNYVKAILELSEILTLRIRNAFMAEDVIFNLTSYKRRQDEAIKVLHAHTLGVIESRKKELKKLNITSLRLDNELGTRNKNAFLDLLLLSEIDGEKISDERIREEVDTFMFEGHDTTTSGICFTLYCLAQNREIQEKIYKEQLLIFNGDVNKDPSYNDLQAMKYLEQVIKESLRLYPSVPLIERHISRDTDIAGLKILKNTSIIINIFDCQRNPEVFENPLEFKPERFDKDAIKSPFSWIAFSAGPRNCIGQKFAMMEMKVTVAAIVKKFVLTPTIPHNELELCSELILRSSNAVQVEFERRIQ